MPAIIARARCIQAFLAQEPGDLALRHGDFVDVTERAADGWWSGSINGGPPGLFPGNHVELVDESTVEDIATPSCGPPAALRFAYDGAASHEGAVLHGLAAAYEGLFRRVLGRDVHGKPAYRHVARGDKWVAFNGTSGWMAQLESNLGTTKGVLLLKDTKCISPDQSTACWHVTPGWKPDRGLKVIGMSEAEAAVWEAESNPWGEGAAVNDAMEMMAEQLSLHPDIQVARDKRAPMAERLAAMDRLEALNNGRGGGGAAAAIGGPPRNKLLEQRGGNAAAGNGNSDGTKAVALPNGVLFIGSVNPGGKPHGGGQLLLKDGSVHVGLFENGAAHGEGVYYDKKGSVHTGSWVTNHRVGPFMVVDPNGGLWDDTYDHFGQRKARKRVPINDGGEVGAAVACRHCGCLFHPTHQYSCKRYAEGSADGCQVEPAHEM